MQQQPDIMEESTRSAMEIEVSNVHNTNTASYASVLASTGRSENQETLAGTLPGPSGGNYQVLKPVRVASESLGPAGVVGRVTQTPNIPQRPTSMRCTGSPTKMTLRAVERRKFIHLWNMVSSLEEVSQYLKELYPADTCIVEELKPKGNYKSYKIGVPEVHYDTCFAADIWPDNARLKAWVPFRGQNSSSQYRPGYNS